MSVWQLEVSAEAEEDIDKLDAVIRRRVLEKLEWLQSNFDNIIPLPLGNEWRGFFKLRVGDWRIIYEIDNAKLEITVHYIDRRDKIYKRH